MSLFFGKWEKGFLLNLVSFVILTVNPWYTIEAVFAGFLCFQVSPNVNIGAMVIWSASMNLCHYVVIVVFLGLFIYLVL